MAFINCVCMSNVAIFLKMWVIGVRFHGNYGELWAICLVGPNSIGQHFGTIPEPFWDIRIVENTTNPETNLFTIPRN